MSAFRMYSFRQTENHHDGEVLTSMFFPSNCSNINGTFTKQDQLRVWFVISDPRQQISDGSQINAKTLSHANTTHCRYVVLVFQTRKIRYDSFCIGLKPLNKIRLLLTGVRHVHSATSLYKNQPAIKSNVINILA
jgi:hypothetical protein